MNLTDSRENPAASSLLIIIGLFLIGFLLMGSIVQIIVMMAIGVSVHDIIGSNGNFSKLPNAWLGLILGQGLGSFVGFVGSAWLYWKFFEKKSWSDLSSKKIPPLAVFGMLVLIQMSFMGFNGWLQQVNQGISFPDSFRNLEILLKETEDKLARTTVFFTNFTTFWQFLIAFFVVAVIAGVGEELIFRGLIMRKILLGTNNPHLAIWLSAFIFALIHFQFYGLLPRMMLGVLFGYFYWWTGNIRVPIFAHIFNNGFAITLVYLHNIGVVKTDLESIDKVPLSIAGFSLFVTLGLLFLLKNYVVNRLPMGDIQ